MKKRAYNCTFTISAMYNFKPLISLNIDLGPNLARLTTGERPLVVLEEAMLKFTDVTQKFPSRVIAASCVDTNAPTAMRRRGMFRANKTLMHGAICGLAFLATFAPLPAMANLVFAGEVVVGGAGFGALPRALTVQSHGPGTNTESGCIAPGPVAGGCVAGSVGGDEAPPIDFPKQGAPSLSSLGITSASQIGILFDAIQPQNANNITVTINDLTLKLYSGATLLTTAVLTPEPMTLPTNPGNGNTDYLFVLNAIEAAAFDGFINGNFADVLALDATISFPNQSAGEDSFVLIGTNTPVTQCATTPCDIPEPGSLGLFATCLFALFGLFGLGKVRRKIQLV